MLDTLHKHLAQLQRDGTITAWTDQEIPAGGELDPTIANALDNAELFIALLSPDYIASYYCYEVELQTALKRHDRGELLIVPIVLEPCDWLSTDFRKLKALPADGKPISTWDNRHTAFLNVVQNLRKLITTANTKNVAPNQTTPGASPSLSRNYKIKKDFDTIEKVEFIKKTFQEITTYLKRYMEEVVTLDNVKASILAETAQQVDFMLVNRNKVNTEAKLSLTINAEQQQRTYQQAFGSGELAYSLMATNGNSRDVNTQFVLTADEYHLFWTMSDYFNQRENKELDAKGIADLIYDKWLESVGIQ